MVFLVPSSHPNLRNLLVGLTLRCLEDLEGSGRFVFDDVCFNPLRPETPVGSGKCTGLKEESSNRREPFDFERVDI